MRRAWLALVSLLLLLSMAGNYWLAQRNQRLSAEVVELQDTATQQREEIGRLQDDLDATQSEVQTLDQELAQLQEAIRALRQERDQLQDELQVYQNYEDALEALDRLEADVRSIRRLVPTEPVERSFLSAPELRAYLEEVFAADYSPELAAAEVRVLSLLELLPPGTDLYNLLLDLYAEQVVGFYDLDERQMYVVGQADLGPTERLTFVHEYVHALQDQLFDLGQQTEAVADDSDRYRALMALAEGDATLAMEEYMVAHLGELMSLEFLAEVLLADTRQFDAAPVVVQEELLFPYEAGLIFVMEPYAARGWAGVNDLWSNPPQSTEQILHPERYPDDTPQLVSMPPLTGTLGEGWTFELEDTLGEFLLRLHLGVRLDEEQVDRAATGWGGDRYALYVREATRDVCLALQLVWDDDQEAAEFAERYQLYAASRYVEEGVGTAEEGIWWEGNPGLYLELDEDALYLIIAPDEETARSVAQRLS